MSEYCDQRRTSLDIVRWEPTSYPGGVERYCEELCAAVWRELHEKGKSPLLEQIWNDQQRVGAVIFECLMAVHRRAEGGDDSVEGIVQELRKTCGPSSDKWRGCYYKYQAVSRLVNELRGLGRAAEHPEHRSIPIAQGAPASSIPVSLAGQAAEPSPAARGSADASGRAEAGRAQKSADQARWEAAAILAQAERRAKEITGEAQRLAKRTGEEAQRQADQLVESAKREAASLLENARQERERSRAEAESFRKTAMEQARLDARQETGRLIQRYLTEAQRKERLGAALPSSEEAEALTRIDRLHDEMCDRTNALQVGWVKAIDEMTERLSGMKSELYRHLRSWQVGLYPLELRPLAERYTELYRILNVEGLISEEMIWLSEHGGQADSAAPAKEAAPDVIGRLRSLNETLTTFLSMYESSLHGLGLYAFFPQEGDAFRPGWHVRAQGGTAGKTIAACVVPGVARRGTDGDDDVLIPAAVELREEEKQHDADRT